RLPRADARVDLAAERAHFWVVSAGFRGVHEEIDLKPLAVDVSQDIHQPRLGSGAVERAEHLQNSNRSIDGHYAHPASSSTRGVAGWPPSARNAKHRINPEPSSCVSDERAKATAAPRRPQVGTNHQQPRAVTRATATNKGNCAPKYRAAVTA